MNIKKFFILCFLFFSCTHKPVAPLLGGDSDQIFREGIYKQDIQVSYIKDGRKEAAEFKAILKKTPHQIDMYAYVGFGIALFKLKDNLKDPVEFSTTEPRIEKNKDFFLKMYPLIKEILLIKKVDRRLQQNEFILDMKPEHFPVVVTFYDREAEAEPRWMTLENKEHFKFTITTREFEPLRRE